MGAHAKDVTGQKFGKLTAIAIAGKSGRDNVWLCRCECGKEATVRLNNLKSGNTSSCGCMKGKTLVAMIGAENG